MSSPLAHAIAGVGAYVAATAPKSAAPVRGFGLASLVVLLGVSPDLMQLLARLGMAGAIGSGTRWDVVSMMHGLAFGAILSAALAGVVPALRENFWWTFFALLAGHSSHALLDWLTAGGVSWLSPFDRGAYRCGLALLPSADASIVDMAFKQAAKTMAIEAAILLPPVWTSLVVGRENSEAKSRGWMVAYALAWPVAAGLSFWTYRCGGRP